MFFSINHHQYHHNTPPPPPPSPLPSSSSSVPSSRIRAKLSRFRTNERIVDWLRWGRGPRRERSTSLRGLLRTDGWKDWRTETLTKPHKNNVMICSSIFHTFIHTRRFVRLHIGWAYTRVYVDPNIMYTCVVFVSVGVFWVYLCDCNYNLAQITRRVQKKTCKSSLGSLRTRINITVNCQMIQILDAWKTV